MLKADAQIIGATGSRSGRRLATAGILLAAAVPAFIAVNGDWQRGGVTRGPLDTFATVAVFAAPAVLAALALAHRPALFIAAAATVCVALPLFVLMLPMLLAAVLWVLAFDRSAPVRWDARRLAAVVVSATLVIGAGGVFLFVRSPTVCTSEVTYADGTVRRATKVESQPNRRTESLPYRPGDRAIESRATCTDGALLPERSALILGMLGVACAGAFMLASDKEPGACSRRSLDQED